LFATGEEGDNGAFPVWVDVLEGWWGVGLPLIVSGYVWQKKERGRKEEGRGRKKPSKDRRKAASGKRKIENGRQKRREG